MPRVLREEIAPLAGAVVSFAALLRGVTMAGLHTQLMAMTLLWYVFRLLHRFLGPMRRRSDHWLVQYGAMAAYYLPFPLAVYAANTVRYSSDSFRYHVHATWSGMLVLGSHPAVSFAMFRMRAYTLGDSPFRDYNVLRSIYLLFLISQPSHAIEAIIGVPIFVMGCIFVAQILSRISEKHRRDAKTQADRMKDTANSVSHFLDISLSNSNDNKDISLSNSFSNLLTRRYFGFDCAEEGNEMVRDFVLHELLSRDHHERAFAIVDAQLALIHEYFFLTPGEKQTPLTEAMHFCFFVSVITPSRAVSLIIQAVYLVLMIASCLWGRHMNPLRTGTDSPVPSRKGQPCWKNKIGQYSLIEDYSRHSIKKMCLVSIKEIILGSPPISIEHHPTEEDAIELPDSVRKQVACTLREINGPPTNGTSSLQRERDTNHRTMDGLSWTCRQKTHTHTILIWHIATCFFDMPPPDLGYEVATALSRYCGYLVAFLPEFLPEPKVRTQSLLQDVLQEAKQMLPMDASKIEELRLAKDETQLTTLEKGVKLQLQLEELETSLRWKVMADFWAETILYIAPSDNVALHFEHLAKGGEFVTHLWAMLSNAGILKRAT